MNPSVRFSFISFFWALLILVEATNAPHPGYNLTILFLLPIALLLLFIPFSLGVLILLSTLQVIVCFVQMPHVDTHWLLFAIINLGLLASFAHLVFKKQLNKKNLLNEFTPVVRIITPMVYFFAVFHKLNWGFLHSETSCAVYFYNNLRANYLPNFLSSYFPIGEGHWGLVIIFSVLMVEILIPIFLIFSRTRGYGILLGILFHATVGVTHYQYSVMMYGMYLFFLPSSTFDYLRDNWGKLFAGLKFIRCAILPVFFLAVFFLFFFKKSIFGYGQIQWQSPFQEFQVFAWLGLNLILLVVYGHLLFIKGIPFEELARPFSLPWKPLILFPILVFINGLTPYLGIKASTSFTMYSNLVTEGKTSNHIILPKGVIQILDYGDDLVYIEDSNHFAFYFYAANGIPLPYLEFKRLINRLIERGEKDIWVKIIRDGQRILLSKIDEQSDLANPLPWYLDKFTHFRINRQLSNASQEKCSW